METLLWYHLRRELMMARWFQYHSKGIPLWSHYNMKLQEQNTFPANPQRQSDGSITGSKAIGWHSKDFTTSLQRPPQHVKWWYGWCASLQIDLLFHSKAQFCSEILYQKSNDVNHVSFPACTPRHIALTGKAFQSSSFFFSIHLVDMFERGSELSSISFRSWNMT